MFAKLHNVQSHEAVGTIGSHYGYPTVVKENNEVWAEIPQDLYDIEVAGGRVRVEDTMPPMESVAETIVMPGETLEDLQVPSEQLVKVDGRTKAAKNK
jgi:hypothetical protein